MSSELVTIHIAKIDWEAQLIKSFLEENGIPVHMSCGSVQDVFHGIGQIRLQVVEENVEEASKLLAEYLARQEDPEETPANESAQETPDDES